MVAEVKTPVFRSHNVSDCKSLSEVFDVIGADDYEMVEIAQDTVEEIRERCRECYGDEYAYQLDDVLNVMPKRWKHHRGVKSPTGDEWIVSDTYDLLQPSELLEHFESAFAELGGKFTRAGYLHGGRKLFVQAELLDFEVLEDDKLKTRITLSSGFDGETQNDFWLGLWRLICSNGMGTWDKMFRANSKHTKNQRSRLAKLKQKMLGSPAEFAKMQARLQKYAKTKIEHDQAKEIIANLMPSRKGEEEEISAKLSNQREKVAAEFDNAGRGTYGASLYDLFNAFTAYNSHHRTFQNTHVRSREENRFVGLNMDDRMASVVKYLDTLAV